MFRVAPQAVCRQQLADLDRINRLTEREQDDLVRLIENSGVPDAVPRFLATLTRGTLYKLLERF